MGTPLNSTLVPRPVPVPARVSSSICLASICQSTCVGRAGGEADAFQRDLAVGVGAQVAGRAACAALRQLELGSLEIGTQRRRVRAGVAAHHQQGIGVLDAAGELGTLVTGVVFEAVGPDVPLSLAHLDIAAEPGVAVDVEHEVVVVALDGDRLVGGIRGRRGGIGRRAARR